MKYVPLDDAERLIADAFHAGRRPSATDFRTNIADAAVEGVVVPRADLVLAIEMIDVGNYHRVEEYEALAERLRAADTDSTPNTGPPSGGAWPNPEDGGYVRFPSLPHDARTEPESDV